MPRRPWLRPVVITLGAFAAVACGAVALLGEFTTTAVTSGTLTAALLVGGFWLFRALLPHLGRLTTCAAIALLGATLLGGWAAVSPTCPGDYTVRCDTAQIADWTLAGALFPVAYLVLLGLPLLGVTTIGKFARRLAAHVKGRRRN